MPNSTPLTPAEYCRAYRQRIRAAGDKGVLVRLPDEVVALLDELKERRGLRNRSQALLQLIEQGRAVAQNMT
jgi:Ribbon-helix-helix protein, copG family